MTQIFLFTDGTFNTRSWPDPGNWNPSNNTVECIGSGNYGAHPVPSGPSWPGCGGGAGAYAKGTNLALTFPVSYVVSPNGDIQRGYTCFNCTPYYAPLPSTGSVVRAQNGDGTPGSGTGGNGGTQFYPTGFAGGKGGDGPAGTVFPGGGGGAGGPHGAGTAGGIGGAATGAGGMADGTFGPAGGVAGSGNGLTGTQFDATHGCGSGGGGATSALVQVAAGNGGNYGGGGGGTRGGGPVGTGGDGLIIITYVPPVIPVAQIVVVV